MNRQGLTAIVIALLAGLTFNALVNARPPENQEDLAIQVQRLKDEVERLKKNAEYDRQMATSRFNEIDAKLDRIEELLRGSSSTRVSRSINPPQLPVRTGTIKLDNRLGVEARVTIDGIVYPVPPLSTRVLRDQPATSFTYEVTAEGFSSTGARRRTLPANETWTLTIY